MLQRYALTLGATFAVVLWGCSETPTPTTPPRPAEQHGVYVLCEGLWGHNNATLARIELPSGRVIPDVLAGTGQILGDVANHMQLLGDTLYVVVSGARSIECFRASTAEWLGRIRLQLNEYPRFLCIVNDTLGLVTDLYRDGVTAIHLRHLRELPVAYTVGPAPEGIAAYGDLVFVANSGYGDYRANEPLAGTVSVLSLSRGSTVATLPVGPNTVSVTVNPRYRRLYALYLHLPSKWPQDSLGGIVEYELPSLRRLREWRAPISGYDVAWTPSQDTLLFLTADGVWGVSVTDTSQAPFRLVSNPQPRYNAWYTLAVDAAGRLWIGNARTYTVAGEVLCINPVMADTQRFPVGVNPGTIAFF
ncbi:MAG: hypothetical protein ABDH31_06055 [Chlorobiota bacterium]